MAYKRKCLAHVASWTRGRFRANFSCDAPQSERLEIRWGCYREATEGGGFRDGTLPEGWVMSAERSHRRPDTA